MFFFYLVCKVTHTCLRKKSRTSLFDGSQGRQGQEDLHQGREGLCKAQEDGRDVQDDPGDEEEGDGEGDRDEKENGQKDDGRK